MVGRAIYFPSQERCRTDWQSWKRHWKKNIKAIDALPQDSEENIDRFLSQKHIIESAIGYEKEYQKNVETLKKYDKSELFTIAGRQFYKTNIKLTPGLPLKLVKEQDDEFDKDAIAVYAENEKIGYVANTDYTKYKLTSSASELKDKIEGAAQAYYLFYLDRYSEIQFDVGRIINDL